LSDLNIEKTDVLIIGSGAAGIRAAYEARQNGVQDITLLSKGKSIHSGSSFFPLVHGWGMQASMPEYNPNDSPEDHLRETLERGLGVCDEKLARILVEEAGDRVRDLQSLGLEFRESNGKISQIVGCFSKGRRAIGAINMESIRKTRRPLCRENG
jgi:fumarate reductase (CoM/CoB) subunit A